MSRARPRPSPPPDTRVERVDGPDLLPAHEVAVLALCHRAFGEDVSALYRAMAPVAHVLAWSGGRLVGHAMWVDRWLAVGIASPRRTAYVELVATEPDRQGQGLGTAVMERVAAEVGTGYPVAGLCTGSPGFYTRLGWRRWRGPLAARRPGGELLETPEEIVLLLDIDGSLAGRFHEPLSVEWREGEVW